MQVSNLIGDVADLCRAFRELAHQQQELLTERREARREQDEDLSTVRTCLELFSGEPELLDEWLFKLNLLLHRSSIESKIRSAKFLLTGDALVWAQQPEVQAVEASWDDWTTKLKVRFGIVDRVLKARIDLLALRQDGPLREYTSRFTALADLIGLDKGTKNFQYIYGLEATLRAKVFQARPATFEAAVLAADTSESARLFVARTEAAPVTRLTEENVIGNSNRGWSTGRESRPTNSSDIQCQSCFRHGHLTRECHSRPPRCDQCGGGHHAQQCSVGSRSSDPRSSHLLCCYICDQPGHFARECPQRQGNGSVRYGLEDSKIETMELKYNTLF